MRFPELQDDYKEIKKLRLKELPKVWEDVKKMLYYQGFPYVSKVIYSKLINRYHNNHFVDDFSIKKTQELIAKKYYKLILWKDIKVYIKGYDVCLASKKVCHKPYKDFQLLPILIH